MSGLRKEGAAFIAVGAAAAATHLGAVWALVALARALPERANLLAFLVAFCVSYEGHRRLTWAAGARNLRSIARWFMVSVAGFALNQALYVMALQGFPGVHYLLLLAMVTVIVAIVTFSLGKYWAFLQRH